MSSKPFLAPVLLGFAFAAGAPIIALIALSGFDWNLIDSPTWVGLNNFLDLDFWPSLGTTLWIAVITLVLEVGLGSLLGYYLSGFSAIYLLPWFAAPIALGVIWKWLLAPTGGLLSSALGFRVDLLTNEFWAPVTVAAVIAWCGTGYTALLFSSGLKSVRENTVFAAQLDGASKFQTLWHIQLPQLRKLIFFVVATVTIQSLTIYDLVYVLTGGSANTDVASIYIIDAALKTFEVGSASALSIMFTVFGSLILVIEYAIYRAVCRRFDD